jgi:hypothetical protein
VFGIIKIFCSYPLNKKNQSRYIINRIIVDPLWSSRGSGFCTVCPPLPGPVSSDYFLGSEELLFKLLLYLKSQVQMRLIEIGYSKILFLSQLLLLVSIEYCSYLSCCLHILLIQNTLKVGSPLDCSCHFQVSTLFRLSDGNPVTCMRDA